MLQVYECCLTNHNMGWPRYAQRALMTCGCSEDDTLLLGLYHSFEVEKLKLTSGSTASVSVDTTYPFEDDIRVSVVSGAQSGQHLTLALRIPGWAEKATVTLPNGTVASGLKNGTLFNVRLPSGASKLTLTLPQKVWLEDRTTAQRKAAAVHRGPLLFSIPVPYTTNAAPKYIRIPPAACEFLK